MNKLLSICIVLFLFLAAGQAGELFYMIFQDNLPESEKDRVASLVSTNAGFTVDREKELTYATPLILDTNTNEVWKAYTLHMGQVTNNGVPMDTARLVEIQGTLSTTQFICGVTLNWDATLGSNSFSNPPDVGPIP